jgi:hypothetical protein
VKVLQLHISLAILLLAPSGFAQNLDDESRTEVNLSDGTTVVFYKGHQAEESNIYYYLPVNMHLSVRNGIPEISFLQYDEEGNRGAILHFLLTWGLSGSSVREANGLLNLKIKDTAIVAGPVLVDAAPVSFLITGNDTVVSIMNNSSSQNSPAPVIPGSKLAASFRFGADDSDYLSGIIRNHKKEIDGEVQMIYIFRTMVRQGYLTKPVEHEWKLSMNLDTIFNILRE